MSPIPRILRLPVWLLYCLSLAFQTGAASERLALVIGNADYNQQTSLVNALNDARDMAQKLQDELGFHVFKLENGDLGAMLDAGEDFVRQLRDTGGVGLFFYSGHALQLEGVNYLIPVDASLQRRARVRYEAYNLNDLVDGMRGRGGQAVNLVILDACRDNPYVDRGKRGIVGSRGLARLPEASGTLIFYAAEAGQTANDNPGERNGLFTKHLLTALDEPGLTPYEVFQRTGRAVLRESRGAQSPWFSGGVMRGDFYFRPPLAENPDTGTAAAGMRPERAFWSSVERCARRECYQAYLERHPQGAFAALARMRLMQPQIASPQWSRPGPTPETDDDSDQDAGRSGKTWREPVIGMEFNHVPGGCGWLSGGTGEREAPPGQWVCVEGFWMGRYEVTVSQYSACVAAGECRNPEWREAGSPYHANSGRNPYYSRLGGALTKERHPIVGLSWEDAVTFADWLSRNAKRSIRLPTEAEWEYACRNGGKAVQHTLGNDSDRVAWYWDNSGAKTHRVGAKAANGLGLHDMAGNVWEWVAEDSDREVSRAPNGARFGDGAPRTFRVSRGGGWSSYAGRVGCFSRHLNHHGSRDYNVGFRLLME